MAPDVLIPEAFSLQIIQDVGEQSFLGEYVRFAMKRTGANPAYHLVSGLALLAGATPHSLYCRELLGANAPSNFWGMVVGHSASDYKTSSQTIAVELAQAAFPDRVASDPYSDEGVLKSLVRSPQCAIFIDDWGTTLKRWNDAGGKGYAAKIKNRLVELYDCNSKTMQSAKELIQIHKPKVSILTSVNPTYLEDYSLPDDWSGGLYSRFFWCYAHRVGDQLDPKVDREQEAFLQERLKALASWQQAAPCLGMDAAGSLLWQQWRHTLKAKLPTDAEERTFSMYGRLEAQAARLMLLLAVDQQVVTPEATLPWKISLPCVELAIRLADQNRSSIQRLMELSVTTPEAKLKRQVLRLLTGQGWTQVGKLTDALGMLVHKLDPVILTLLTEQKIEQMLNREGYRMIRLRTNTPINTQLLEGLEGL